MRKPTFRVTEDIFMEAVGGMLFRQAPNHQPRNVETIMVKVRDAFRANPKCENVNEFRFMHVSSDEWMSFLKDMLWSIPEFLDLNLSQKEVEAGIKVDDENRQKFNFITREDVYDSESWKDEFIDLDAFLVNALNAICSLTTSEADCFGCSYDSKDDLKKYTHERCKTCVRHHRYKDNFTQAPLPKDGQTISCQIACMRGCGYTCCAECKPEKKSECDMVCTSEPVRCMQVV